jgi:hypothetical protein
MKQETLVDFDFQNAQTKYDNNDHHLPGYTLASKLSLYDLVVPTPGIRIQVLLITYLKATEIIECKIIPSYGQLAKHMTKLYPLSTEDHPVTRLKIT